MCLKTVWVAQQLQTFNSFNLGKYCPNFMQFITLQFSLGRNSIHRCPSSTFEGRHQWRRNVEQIAAACSIYKACFKVQLLSFFGNSDARNAVVNHAKFSSELKLMMGTKNPFPIFSKLMIVFFAYQLLF